LNPPHIYLKKKKKPKTRTLKRIVMMFQFDDDYCNPSLEKAHK
jgi:hypothetical protein